MILLCVVCSVLLYSSCKTSNIRRGENQ